MNNSSTASTVSRDWLEALIREKCEVDAVWNFQSTHALDLVNRKDVFLVVAPGMGKMNVLLAPLLVAQARRESGIAIIVVPTKLLGEQTAHTAVKRGLRAIAINEDTVRESYFKDRDLFKELENGNDVRIGIMEPQMLSSERMHKLLGDQKFKRTTRWVAAFVVHQAKRTWA